MATLSELHLMCKSKSIMVSDDPKAKLMYYLSCINSVLEMEQGDQDFQRLTNYQQHQRLSESETQQLIDFCLLLSPDVLLNKCIFQNDATSPNDFYLPTEEAYRRLVARSVEIGGQQCEVRNIMTFTASWLQTNYREPMQHFVGETEAQAERRKRAEAEILRRWQMAKAKKRWEREMRERRWRGREEEERRQPESCVVQ